MLLFKRNIFVVLVMLFLSACAAHVQMADNSASYAYAGEKYGKINIVLADQISTDASKAERARQLNLESAIQSALRAQGLYDETSANAVNVSINTLHIRNAFNAIMWGALSGTDNMDGTVKLVNDSNVEKASFDITASYGAGGFSGGQNDVRLGWLSNKFAELTANTIKGKQ